MLEALKKARRRVFQSGNNASEYENRRFDLAIAQTAEQILRESHSTAPMAPLVRLDVAVAAHIVVNEVVHHASCANMVSTVGVLEDRWYADLSFFFLLMPVIAAELKAEGVSVDYARFASFHLTTMKVYYGDEEIAARKIASAATLAQSLVKQADQHPSIKLYIETLWKAVVAFARSGDKERLSWFEPAYLLFVTHIWPTRVTAETIAAALNTPRAD